MKQYFNVPVRMRDGVSLSTDIRLPDHGGPFPVLVQRTPYGQFDPGPQQPYINAGYATVGQDCRGRFDSEGRFAPFHEAEDGEDLLAWVRAQPWCDGRIGLLGGSYNATTILAAAWNGPEGVRALAPSVMGCDAFKDMLYHQGVFNLSLAVGWGLGVGAHTPQINTYIDWQRLFRHLPLISIDEAAGYDVPYLREWMAHPIYDDFWWNISVEAHYPGFTAPALHRGGWYDVYAEGVTRNFVGMHQQAPGQLVMGPWGHGLNTRTLAGVDFGQQAVIDLDAMERRWMDRWVKGEPNGVEHEAPVRIFIMGTNVWREEREWPLARAVEQPWYLAGGGRANSRFGDGALTDTPGPDAADHYLYNPDNPVPTLGGGVLGEAGPVDQSPIERRDDVLVYTGPELRAPLEVTGHVSAVIYASSDAVDTDFVARLCDVHPDGRSVVLCDGIARARFREGLDREVFMTPGTVYAFEIRMGVTAATLLPSHRLRVEITSSSFPRFARNLNTDEPFATATRMICAQQTLYHGKPHPSRVLLPVVCEE